MENSKPRDQIFQHVGDQWITGCKHCGDWLLVNFPTPSFCLECEYTRSQPPELRRRFYASAPWKALRLVVFELKGRLCVYCHCDANTVDHAIPLSRGGTHEPSNLQPICRSCNVRKQSKTHDEFLASQYCTPAALSSQ